MYIKCRLHLGHPQAVGREDNELASMNAAKKTGFSSKGFDDELGDDFLTSWKPGKLNSNVGLELEDSPPKTSKKFNFSKFDVDLDIDGGFNKLAAFDIDLSGLDLPSSPAPKARPGSGALKSPAYPGSLQREEPQSKSLPTAEETNSGVTKNDATDIQDKLPNEIEAMPETNETGDMLEANQIEDIPAANEIQAMEIENSDKNHSNLSMDSGKSDVEAVENGVVQKRMSKTENTNENQFGLQADSLKAVASNIQQRRHENRIDLTSLQSTKGAKPGATLNLLRSPTLKSINRGAKKTPPLTAETSLAAVEKKIEDTNVTGASNNEGHVPQDRQEARGIQEPVKRREDDGISEVLKGPTPKCINQDGERQLAPPLPCEETSMAVVMDTDVIDKGAKYSTDLQDLNAAKQMSKAENLKRKQAGLSIHALKAVASSSDNHVQQTRQESSLRNLQISKGAKTGATINLLKSPLKGISRGAKQPFPVPTSVDTRVGALQKIEDTSKTENALKCIVTADSNNEGHAQQYRQETRIDNELPQSVVRKEDDGTTGGICEVLKSPSRICSSQRQLVPFPREEISMPVVMDNDVIDKAEKYSRDLQDMSKKLKQKHEEAKDLLVRALVSNNSLLMLNSPMHEDKIQLLKRSVKDLLTGDTTCEVN